jgi:uncharacterized small protein (DUF1192 family)
VKSITRANSAFTQNNPTQDAMSNDEIEQRCTVLRQELKVWEKKFAAENNGRKAGRDDIKANAEICTYRTILIPVMSC